MWGGAGRGWGGEGLGKGCVRRSGLKGRERRLVKICQNATHNAVSFYGLV